MTKVAKARGRRPSDVALTREQIVTAALDILTVKGIEALSVRDLAKVLGVYPAAIYHHISTKNELLSEVVAFALRELEPPSEGGSWQDWLRQLFIRYRAAVQQTPAVATLIGARIVSNGGVGPDLIEHILATLIRAGFDERNIVQAFNVVIAAKVGFVTLEFASLPDEADEFREMMRSRINTVNVESTPLLARYLPLLSNKAFMLRWDGGDVAPLDESFEAYTSVVLHGLETMLENHN